jgi:ascorbate-specific PTS system EIIC-type component UlaA
MKIFYKMVYFFYSIASMVSVRRAVAIVLIYLSGYFFAYDSTKAILMSKKHTKQWTVGDRRLALVLSTGSWLVVGANGIYYCVNRLTENQDKANW